MVAELVEPGDRVLGRAVDAQHDRRDHPNVELLDQVRRLLGVDLHDLGFLREAEITYRLATKLNKKHYQNDQYYFLMFVKKIHLKSYTICDHF